MRATGLSSPAMTARFTALAIFACALNTHSLPWTRASLTLCRSPVPAAQRPTQRPKGRLFVGDQLGELWVINAKGTPSLAAGPVMIGGGGCGAAHPPRFHHQDSSSASQRFFAFSGNAGTTGASAVVAQLQMDLTGLVSVHVGLGSVGATIAKLEHSCRRLRQLGPHVAPNLGVPPSF
jgi:hypothetical protein